MKKLLEKLIAQEAYIKSKRVFAGFDGSVDTIVKPIIRSGNETIPPVYFKTIAEFGKFIAGYSNKSASIEMDIITRRMGGNMPNFARAIAELGVTLSCMGMLFDNNGSIDPIFSDLSGNIMSFAPASVAAAVEFDDGKLFFAPRYVLNADPWQLLEMSWPVPLRKKLLNDSDLIACLNWGELSFAGLLWRDLYEECASIFSVDKRKYVFFDLCDFNRKTDEEIRSILNLIGQFSLLRTTILSLNRNEVMLLDERIFKKRIRSEISAIAENIHHHYSIDEIIVHSNTVSFAFIGNENYSAETKYIAMPKISTGAGDNFNAAYAFASLMGLTAKERLGFANLYAYTYLFDGKSPGLRNLRP
jgi:sugar/nucleoside kinase (ribokinase family)